MSQELFQAVHTAEENADRIVQDAQHQARELIKAAEAEIKTEDRKASLAQRTRYQSIIEERRKAFEANMPAMRMQVEEDQRKTLDAARAKLDQVSQMIFERIWNDGNR